MNIFRPGEGVYSVGTVKRWLENANENHIPLVLPPILPLYIVSFTLFDLPFATHKTNTYR